MTSPMLLPLVMLVPELEREGANDRHQQRLNKRKSTAKSLQQLREELFCGEFDGLAAFTEIRLVVTHY
jgi:hypothetical protein